MAVRFSHLTKPYDPDWEEFQILYNFPLTDPESAQPLFGANILLPLNPDRFNHRQPISLDADGRLLFDRAGKSELMRPKMDNLALHSTVGHWILDNILDVVGSTKGVFQPNSLDSRFYEGACYVVRSAYETRVIRPLRRELQQLEMPIYLHSVPTIEKRTDLKTGLMIFSEGERVVTLLPTTVEIALHYKTSQERMEQFSGEVLWLIGSLSGRGRFRDPADLTRALDLWPKYSPPAYRKHIEKGIRRKNPGLLNRRSLRALLLE